MTEEATGSKSGKAPARGHHLHGSRCPFGTALPISIPANLFLLQYSDLAEHLFFDFPEDPPLQKEVCIETEEGPPYMEAQSSSQEGVH